MAYQTPRTWTTSELVTAAMMNQDVRDNISFLANPPACRVYHNANQNITNGIGNQVVLFNSERYDTDNMHSTVTNTGRITFNTAGIYVISFSGVLFAATDYTYSECYVQMNGTTPILLGAKIYGPTHNSPSLFAGGTYKFAVNDYITVQLGQANAAAASRNLLSAGNYSPEFSATWIGLG